MHGLFDSHNHSKELYWTNPLEFYTSMYVGSVDVHCSEGVVPRASDSFLSLLQWTSTALTCCTRLD